MVFDRDSDWFFLRLNQFKLAASPACGEDDREVIEVDFSDGGSSHLKRGIILDFIELRSVVRRRLLP